VGAPPRRLSATRLVVEFRDDDFGYARGLHLQSPETSRHRSYLGVKEATVSGPQGPVEVTVGKQIYAWGTADAFNPTDNVNPYDYSTSSTTRSSGCGRPAPG
jgi:hypothetical protein